MFEYVQRVHICPRPPLYSRPAGREFMSGLLSTAQLHMYISPGKQASSQDVPGYSLPHPMYVLSYPLSHHPRVSTAKAPSPRARLVPSSLADYREFRRSRSTPRGMNCNRAAPIRLASWERVPGGGNRAGDGGGAIEIRERQRLSADSAIPVATKYGGSRATP
jgi:hypothetical protein